MIGFRLDGQAVVITGASRGIGACCALACAEAGAHHISLLGRSWNELNTVASEVRARGAEAGIIACDVTSEHSIKQAFAAVDEVDALVISAGANQPEPFVEVTADTLDRLFALNVRGAFLVAQQATRKMIERRHGGTIVMISSQMGHVGAPNRTVYCATKHAVEGMTKAMAVELAPFGIRAVSIAPTFVRTEMTASQLDDPDIGPALLAQIPEGRFGSTDEVAAAVVYAASPAAGLITGSSLLLDGGWTAR